MSLMNRVAPSKVVAGILAPQSQRVDFEKYIGKKTNFGDEGSEMLYVSTIENINSEASVGQQWNKALSAQSYSLGQIGIPYFKISAYVEYSNSEASKFEQLANGSSLQRFLEALAVQAINQKRHQGILHGFNGVGGITANASLVSVPADSASQETLVKYNVAELQGVLSKIARTIADASFGMAKPVVIASSARVINYLKTVVVPLTAGQKEGGGIDSIAGVYSRAIGEWLGVGPVDFVADELLKNADSTGTKDVILVIARGNDEDVNPSEDSTNAVGELDSNIRFNTMYDAGANGLQRIDRQPDFDINSSLYTLKMTPGVTLREEAVAKVEIKYE